MGRGERVVPGVWRLRLPLPWPGVPHCNAWALAAGDGIVLVDAGMHQPGSLAHLERALGQVNLRLEHVRLLVCTHAHADHYGQAATIMERAGCPLWIHPALEHVRSYVADPDGGTARRLEVARQSGVPEEPLAAWSQARRVTGSGIAALVEPDRPLTEGATVTTDLGDWHVVETPGHAPSHVCLHQPDHDMLVSGDHLLGRVSLYYDLGYTPDPVGEFLESLDKVARLKARLCLSGHGKPFADIDGHLRANRELVAERVEAAYGALADGSRSAYDLIPAIYGTGLTAGTAAWWLSETNCYLRHLEQTGRVSTVEGERPTMWRHADR